MRHRNPARLLRRGVSVIDACKLINLDDIPGTAADGTLAPPDHGFPEAGTPGPDGMQILANGMVEFAAGGRSNTVPLARICMPSGPVNTASDYP